MEQESNESDGIAKGNEGAKEPREIGGKRNGRPGNPEPEPRRPPPSRLELLCRKAPESARWEVILYADKECEVAAVRLNDESLDFADGQCRIPSLKGRVTVSSRDKKEHDVALFEGVPLIFKVQKNWAGSGRRMSGITSGHFIVIAPRTWQRTGNAPVESDGCDDPDFRAHYFYRDADTAAEFVDGFCEWAGPLTPSSIKLTGQYIYDDSDDGMLFAGHPPVLERSPDIAWARVGEETKVGWGQNFCPKQKALSTVLNGKEGRFFLRVYDREMSMLDSLAFRYVGDLGRVEVNGVEYTQDTLLVPPPTGYPITVLRLVGVDGSILPAILPVEACQTALPSGAISVPAHPGADRVSCSLGSGAPDVSIVLELPRIWWRLEKGETDPGDWHDTPLIMTREEFRNHAYAGMTLSILSKRCSSVHAGFDDQQVLPYSRKIQEDRIAIPLDHFVDHAQIDQRLNAEAHFNVEWAGEVVSLIVVVADPLPEIVLFESESATLFDGEETTLKWATRNTGNAGVALEPDIGAVETDGICTVRPARTTRYTLTVSVAGLEDIIRSVTVTVNSPPRPVNQSRPHVISPVSGWRIGKGFSPGEFEAAGLTLTEAVERSIPIDRRRRTSHQTNVDLIRSMLDA